MIKILRRFLPGMNVEEYLTTEHRMNLKVLEDALNNTSETGQSSASGGASITGEIKIFAGTALPQGALWCDGASYSVASYQNLFNAIGYAFGGSGANFNVPDLRGLVPRGVDGSAGRDPDKASRTAIAAGGNTGNNVGSYQADQVISHTHSYNEINVVASGPPVSTTTPDVPSQSSSTGAFGGNETRMKNIYVNYIIMI